jgi:hypothetical protein
MSGMARSLSLMNGTKGAEDGWRRAGALSVLKREALAQKILIKRNSFYDASSPQSRQSNYSLRTQ